jgi:hypothetical protein
LGGTYPKREPGLAPFSPRGEGPGVAWPQGRRWSRPGSQDTNRRDDRARYITWALFVRRRSEAKCGVPLAPGHTPTVGTTRPPEAEARRRHLAGRTRGRRTPGSRRLRTTLPRRFHRARQCMPASSAGARLLWNHTRRSGASGRSWHGTSSCSTRQRSSSNLRTVDITRPPLWLCEGGLVSPLRATWGVALATLGLGSRFG